MTNKKLCLSFVILSMLVLLIGINFSIIASETYDLKGKTVTFIDYGETFPEDDPELQALKEKAEEKFNCIIESKATETKPVYWPLMISRLISGDSKYDIWRVLERDFWGLIGQKPFYSISEEYYEEHGISKSQRASSTFRGQSYGFGQTGYDHLPFMFFTYWNKDLFEKEGLPNLYDLYESGDWTWNKFEEIARKATIPDENGDGIAEQYGVVGLLTATMYLANTNGARPIIVDDEGNFKFGFDKPAAIETLSRMKKWIQEDKIGATKKEPMWERGQSAMIIKHFFSAEDYQEQPGNVGIVPLPMGSNTDNYRYSVANTSFKVLPANSAQPKALLALYDFIFGVNQNEVKTNLEDLILNSVADKESYQIVMEGLENWDGTSLGRRAMMDEKEFRRGDNGYMRILGGDLDPAQAMREIKPQMQADIDDLLNQ